MEVASARPAEQAPPVSDAQLPATPPAPAPSAAVASRRFLCVHGHFYQPPRENPWLDRVEEQPTASPYHDWNSRITSECYGPNTAARIVNAANEILDIRNNYEKISFNFGPTLLSWMERERPEVYQEILAADARSADTRGGHGNALAQIYNHLIAPLATRRDKETQVVWGIEDFRRRFRRDPEGMWLSEAAVDTECLEVMAANGIVFTVLAPRQAKNWRVKAGTGSWRACNGAIDPSRAYSVPLPSGRSIAVFFYDGPISQAVAFEGLLVNGDRFASRLVQGFSGNRAWPQLVHIATDGESYGHHHRHGEMALSYALHIIESRGLARLTNYGEFLALHPPECEAQVWERSSWSCVHGVERWRSDCGCNSGGKPGWRQAWRAPLREAYDTIKAAADEVYDTEGSRLFHDPWAARNSFIDVILRNNREAAREFLQRHLRVGHDDQVEQEALRLAEIQRNSMLMYTSCAWFFDDIGGIETLQTMRYAARLLQLIAPYRPDLEEQFLAILGRANSNDAALGTGARLYREQVRHQAVDLHRVIANYAVSNFDRHFEGVVNHYGFSISESDCEVSAYADWRLKLSRISAVSPLSGERHDAVVCVLYLGGVDFQCKMGPDEGLADYEILRDELFATFSRRSLADVVRALDRHFGSHDRGVPDLFDECRRELLAQVTHQGFERFNSTLFMMYDENRKLMEYLMDNGAPLPSGFLAVAEYVLRSRLMTEMKELGQRTDASQALALAQEARRLRIDVLDAALVARLGETIETVFRELAMIPTGGAMRHAESLLDVAETLGARMDFWEEQNILFALVHGRALPAYLASRSRYVRKPNTRPHPALRELAFRLRISPEPLAQAGDVHTASNDAAPISADAVSRSGG